MEDEEDAALYSSDEAETEDAPNGELKLDGERERRLVVTKWEEKSVLDALLSKSRLIANLYVPLPVNRRGELTPSRTGTPPWSSLSSPTQFSSFPAAYTFTTTTI